MGMVTSCAEENKKIKNIIAWLRFKADFRQEHPNYFDADGLLIFVGPQGSGKTLSAVNYVYKILEAYPMSKICTNLALTEYPTVTFDQFKEKYKYMMDDLKSQRAKDTYVNEFMYKFYLKENRVFPFIDNDDFSKYSNGEEGLIFLVDEIQLYLNSLESKNINMDVMTQISQQRKQRKHIIATSQVFGRMAKPVREQFSNVIVCKKLWGFVQRNSYVDRDSIDSDNSADTKITGKVKKNFLWFHHPAMYKRYDTYSVIEKGKFIAGEQQKENLYEVNKPVLVQKD
jgi:hypothetical protein